MENNFHIQFTQSKLQWIVLTDNTSWEASGVAFAAQRKNGVF